MGHLPLGETDIALRLILAAALGALVGYERETHNQPAGLRTHMILAIGAALAMCVSINLPGEYSTEGFRGDPGRLAAQVVSGIGFLGAGAILRYGASIKGLTTATSLWTMAIIGLAVGAGYHYAALAGTGLLLVILTILNAMERKFIRGVNTRMISLKIKDRPGVVNDVKKAFAVPGVDVRTISIAKDLQAGEVEVEVTVNLSTQHDLEQLTAELSKIEGALGFDIQ